MLRIRCPWCGTRDEDEFTHGGAWEKRRPENPSTLSDEEWAKYLFEEKNARGLTFEKWRHTFGCRQWFICKRHTVTHEITQTLRIPEVLPRSCAVGKSDQTLEEKVGHES